MNQSPLRLLAFAVLTLTGCVHTPTVLDLTDDANKCSLHGTPLETEEVSVWHGTVSGYRPFSWDEEIRRFPNANDRTVATRGAPEYEHIESALISFCPDCRREKAAALKAK